MHRVASQLAILRWVLGLILCGWGLLMVAVILARDCPRVTEETHWWEVTGPFVGLAAYASEQPIFPKLLFRASVGLVPIGCGLVFLRMRPLAPVHLLVACFGMAAVHCLHLLRPSGSTDAALFLWQDRVGLGFVAVVGVRACVSWRSLSRGSLWLHYIVMVIGAPILALFWLSLLALLAGA
jgi:hypothetical protein